MMNSKTQWPLPGPQVTLIFFFVLASSVVSKTLATYSTFEDSMTEKFNHIAVHGNTGRVYVGGVNRIYQLNQDLHLEAVAKMGPHDDSVNCPSTRVCPNENKRPTHYYNKALIIDYSQGDLITCGTLFQGLCSVHDLNNVTTFRTPSTESVVANDASASTVVFKARGPNDLPRTSVLYVGVSYSGKGPYIADIPAVSSRSIDPSNIFAIAKRETTTGTKIFLNSLYRERYPVTYVYGFSYKGFSYFVTVQKRSVDSPGTFATKLVRVCQNDEYYYSYTEVPLICKDPDGTHYNLAQAAYIEKPGSEVAKSFGMTTEESVLFVVFAKSEDQEVHNNEPSQNSAVCMYSLNTIRQKFTQNIQHCHSGQGERGLEFTNPSTSCIQTQLEIRNDFCGLDVNTPLGGTIPIENFSVLRFPGVLLSAVAATSTASYTVVFLGTSKGHLKKVVIETLSKASEYNDIVLKEGSPVNKDMVFDKTKDHIYVMTERKVTKVNVHECNVFITCMDCFASNDPYCGWCSSENKCTTEKTCSQALLDPLYWPSLKSDQCAQIIENDTPQIALGTHRYINLKTLNVAVSEKGLYCIYTITGKSKVLVPALQQKDLVRCPTPRSLDPLPPGEHQHMVRLSVREKDGIDLVSTNVTFFDCRSFTTCTECVSSDFPCDWCISRHRCTHNTGENCRNDVFVNGLASPGPSIRHGPGFCPRITKNNDASAEILVASGLRKRVTVKIENIPTFAAAMRIVCQFNIEGNVVQIHAILLADTVYCDSAMFSYESQKPNITASLAVIWDSIKPFDNPENIHVLIYKCSEMGSSCSSCLELPEKYSCGWCHGTDDGSCKISDDCQSPAVWSSQGSYTCPAPQVLPVTTDDTDTAKGTLDPTGTIESADSAPKSVCDKSTIESEKLQTLKSLAERMENIDSSLKEFIEMFKRRFA